MMFSKRLFATAAFTGCLGWALTAWAVPGAGDWPRFRGPNGSGVAEAADVPAAFTEKNIKWTAPLPGTGHCSPVVIGKKVFLTAADPETAQRHILCLDLDTGKTLWHREYSSRTFKQNRDNSYASATCAADEKRVYFTFTLPESYKVYCLDHEGKELWTHDMGTWQSEHGCGCSPILLGDRLIVPNDQLGPTASLVALDAVTGKVKWQIARKPGITAHATPCVFQPDNGKPQIIITCSTEGMTSIDPATGKVNWVAAMNPKLRCVGSPSATTTLVGAMCGVGGTARLGIVLQPDPAHPSKEPKLLYKIPTGAAYPNVPTMLFAPKKGLLFLWSDSGTVTCLKAATGEQVWQHKVGGDYYSSPVLAGDKLFNVTKKGQVICVSATETFKELGRSELGEGSHATPAVAGDRLLFHTTTKLICVGK